MNDTLDDTQDGGSGGGFLNHIPTILWQRRWMIIPPFIVLAIAGIATAFLLPATYRSTATLLVESQELPNDMVTPTSGAVVDQRIAKIRQQVLSRGDLISLIEQNDLYQEERRRRPLSEIVEDMREATSVESVSSAGAAPAGGSNTVAFQMAFNYRDPVKAQAVMQSFVGRFLEIDTSNLEEQTSNTVSFLQDQATKLQGQISQLEGQIRSIKSQNGLAISAAGAPIMADSSGYEGQAAALEAQNRQLMLTTRRVKDPKVAAAEQNLAVVRSTFSETHPDVVRAKQQLAELKALEKSEGPSTDIAMIQTQIQANNAQIAALNRARTENAARATAQMASSARGPAVMEQVMQLDSRANQLRSQYQDVSASLLRAQNTARMARERRGDRLTVVEPPAVPDTPVWPNRPVIMLAGVGGGLALGLLLALILEFVLRPIRGVDQVESIGIDTLAVVPTFKIDRGGFFSRFRRNRSAPAEQPA